MPSATGDFPTIGTDGRRLLAAAETDWSAPVPSCPDWDAAELVRHTGGILGWMEAVVTERSRVGRRGLPAAPEGVDELPEWFLTHLDRTDALLADTDPHEPSWTFSSRGDDRVGWWRRRLAIEIAIHRRDAQDAVRGSTGTAAEPIDGDLAAAGVEEFMLEFLPGLLAGESAKELTGTLHLHATDGPCEWWVDLDATDEGVPGHRTGDTAVRGTRSDLLLWLTNRVGADDLDIVGPPEVARRWRLLTR